MRGLNRNGLVRVGLAAGLALLVACADEPAADVATTPETNTEPTDEPGTEVEPTTDDTPAPAEVLAITIGEGIGAVRVGMTYGEVRELLGEPSAVVGYEHQILGKFPEYGVELALGSPEPMGVTDDSLIVAVGTLPEGNFSGLVVPGMTEVEALEALGATPDAFDEYAFYETGISLLFDEERVVKQVGVYPSYTIRQTPPPMLPAQTMVPAEGGAR